MTKILIFGASITYGAWDKEGGWVRRLRKFLDDSSKSYLVYNLGVSGATTEDILERFEFETKQRTVESPEIIFIFAIGINDSLFIHSKNSSKLAPEEFKNNLQKLINLAQKFSSTIVFAGLTPADESKVDPIPWLPDGSYKNEHIQRFDKIIKSVCAKKEISFVEIFNRWIKSDYKKLLEDGLHPNSAGHQKIFEAVKNFLVENEII